MTGFVNRTRRSRSIPLRLLREGRPHLLPLYYLLRTSDLAREAIDHSGSARFADHIYRGRPRGRFLVGTLLDALLLQLPSARSLGSRYRYARAEIERLIGERSADGLPLDVLAVPCGLARELFAVAGATKHATNRIDGKVRLYGMDLDAALIERLRARARTGQPPIEFWTGNALEATAYRRPYDAIVSLGFTEFLDDDAVVHFYRLVRGQLKPRGRLVTSGLARHPLSDYALRHLAELPAHYRTEADLRDLAQRAGFGRIHSYRDRTRLLTMLVAEEA